MKQSPNDHKQYRPITLPNGLNVLLVHNADSAKSAGALCVNVGHFDDPLHRQGMAHFLEHMLFLGTQKYPDSGEYQQFISQHGGTNNAWTATEHTCYFFDIHYQQFEQALDRFSQFFISPLLSKEFVEKERQNIDAEFQLKYKDDIRRLYDVHKATVNPKHPFAKFSVGNHQTLADNQNQPLYQEMMTFFDQHYHAKAMTLVLEGQQSLDELEHLATEKFSAIKSGKVKQNSIKEPLYLDEHLQKLIHVKPVKDDRQLIISFALPNINHLYQTKPEATLVYLLGHEGEGSILSKLKQENLALGLSAGGGVMGANFKDFNISIHLTEYGEKQINRIVAIVFHYLGLIDPKTIAEFYYQEKKAIAELSFNYQEKLRPLDSVCQLAINMHYYPIDDVLYGEYKMAEFDRENLCYLYQFFTPTNMRLIMVSQQGNFDQTSNWYQVPYSISDISKSIETLPLSAEDVATLKLPEKNLYIVDNPAIVTPDNSPMDLPTKITQSDGYALWFLQDNHYNVPKGYIYIGIDCPVVVSSEKHIAMTRLFVDTCTAYLCEKLYDAELAGIHYHLYAHQAGLTLQISGLSEKQPLLLTQLLAELSSFTCAEDKFELFKNQLLTYWRNTETNKSISQLFSSLSTLMQPASPSNQSLCAALASTTYEDFKAFYPKLFDLVAIEGLIHGNWHRQHAQQISDTITTHFKHALAHENNVAIETLDIQGQGPIKLPLLLEQHDHACVLYIPMANRHLSVTAKTMLASQILAPAFFHQMRTENQYGYLVGVNFVPINRFAGLAFYIQSPHVNADNLYLAIEDFVNHSHHFIEEISDQQWQQLVLGLTSQLEEKYTSLRVKSQRFWAAICNDDDTFSQKAKLIREISAVTKDDMQHFIEQNVSLLTNKDHISLLSYQSQNEFDFTETDELLEKIQNKCSTKR
ncbi:insulinase family protein [Thalassotalea ganghwensis]